MAQLSGSTTPASRRVATFATAAIVAAGAGLLCACGGGGGGGSDASVSNMQAAPAAYGRATVWTIGGLNLDQGVVLTVTGGNCDNLVELPNGSATQRQFSCVPTTLGRLDGRVSSAGGTWLASLGVDIPVPRVRLTTSSGAIEVELDPLAAPLTVRNFLGYVNGNFYDNTIFHRVIRDVVVQGGGYSPGTANPSPKPPTAAPIALESNNGLRNLRGSLAMARTSEPASATSQFYFNVVDNPAFDYQSDAQPGYAVFGTVVAGLDVIDAIHVVPTRSVPALGLTHLPVTQVTVTSARQIR